MAARYVDIPSIVQVIGCIYQNPYLLGREDEYFFNEDSKFCRGYKTYDPAPEWAFKD